VAENLTEKRVKFNRLQQQAWHEPLPFIAALQELFRAAV
jgi:hypothetical protein